MPNKVLLFAGIYFLLLLLPTPWLPLQESTEARYAEIGREMLVSGNYLDPTLNGILHYHKPPLTYWGIASGMRLFGVNDFGSRFFGIAAAALTLLFVYRTALLITRREESAWTSMLIMAAAPLFLAISRIVATDIYLTLFTAGALFFLFRQIFDRKSMRNACWFGLFLGLGFMTKGPIIFLFTLLPYVVAKIWDEQHRKVFTFREGAAALLVFAVVALPWYVAVAVRNPALVEYFLKVQTVDRVATERFGRNKPFWFFIAIFASTFLPFIFHVVAAAAKKKALSPRVTILWTYVVVPLIVFSAAKSKLAPYILPLYGISSIIAAEAFESLRVRWAEAAMKGLVAAVCVIVAVAGFVYPPLSALKFPLLIAGGAGLLGCRHLIRLHGPALARASAVFTLGLACIGYQALPSLEKTTKGYEQMTAKINSIDPDRRYDTVIYKSFLPSVSFYRGKTAIMALGRMREVEFEKNEGYRKGYAENATELVKLLNGEDRVFMITEPGNLGEFQQTTGFSCDGIFSQRRYDAYYCTSQQRNPAGLAATDPASHALTR